MSLRGNPVPLVTISLGSDDEDEEDPGSIDDGGDGDNPHSSDYYGSPYDHQQSICELIRFP